MITISGHSDDLIEVDDTGSLLCEEFSYTDNEDGDLIAISDGTLLRIRFDAEGNWRITPVHKGTAFDRIEQTDGSDGYTDRAYIREAAWVAHAAESISSDGPAPDTDSISDGHHTFGELYEHRRALTAVLAAVSAPSGRAWRSKVHHPDDETPMFEGNFIVGIELPTGVIRYHYDLAHWDDFAAVPELPYAPLWDGHGPTETLARCFRLARDVAPLIKPA